MLEWSLRTTGIALAASIVVVAAVAGSEAGSPARMTAELRAALNAVSSKSTFEVDTRIRPGDVPEIRDHRGKATDIELTRASIRTISRTTRHTATRMSCQLFAKPCGQADYGAPIASLRDVPFTLGKESALELTAAQKARMVICAFESADTPKTIHLTCEADGISDFSAQVSFHFEFTASM
jgi:hypothetical protein